MTPKIPAGGNALCSAVVLGGVPPVAMHVCALCSLCVTAACTLKLKQDTAPVSAGGKYSEKKRDGLEESDDCSGATRQKAAPHGSNRADPHMSHTIAQKID